MDKVGIVGIDLARHSFQLHRALSDGSVGFRRKLSREKVLGFLDLQPRCVVAMEACPTIGAWSRGPFYPAISVKPFVKRQKNDAAEVICELPAATRMFEHSGLVVNVLVLESKH